jgi:photosystem II stability/assembly factor-like uncharacterized protein
MFNCTTCSGLTGKRQHTIKKFVLLSCVLLSFQLFLTGEAISQWVWQNPLPQGNPLQGVSFCDESNGIAVGRAGTTITTTDGGTTWSSSFYGTNPLFTFTQVSYLEPNIAWAVGANLFDPFDPNVGIFKTTDGGSTWTNQYNAPFIFLQGIHFIDANTGTAVGAGFDGMELVGLILRTTNGGSNWEQQESGTSTFLYGVSFVDANIGMIVGEAGKILKTTNGGSNWVQQTSGTTNELISISLSDVNTGTITGQSGTILRTTNGGTTWNSQTSGTTSTLPGVSFADVNTGTAVGTNGIVLRTTNGGNNWNVSTEVSGILYDVFLTNTITAIAVGDPGTILHTTNGGLNWVNQKITISSSSLNGVSFSDLSTGTAVGQNGAILRTINGGQTWVSQTSGVSNNLNDIWFTNPNTGTAVGASGTILHTTNGGESWIAQISGGSQALNGVFFSDANTGTAVGASGIIRRTINGGNNWVQQTSGTSQALNGVAFINSNTGIAVGNSGTILKTTDGGTSWVSQTSGTSNILRGVVFKDPDNAFVAGNSGTILKTTNGGSNWIAQTSGTTNILKSISFPDLNNGIAVGDQGTIVRTSDGGSTWFSEFGSTGYNLNGVILTDSNNGTAVGSGGTILRCGDEPPPPVNPNFGSNNQIGDNLYFFANSSDGASGAPSQPEFMWRDTTGSINLYADGSNQAPGIFAGNDDNGRWDIIGQLGGGNIKFFGQDYTNIYIGTNGITGFNAFNSGAAQPPSGGLNQPDITEGIFPLWIDMNIGYTGVTGRRISYKVTGEELIVTYTRIPVYAPLSLTNDPDRYVSFQVILEFNNAFPTQNSRIFISYNYDETGPLFITEYNDATLRTHLAGIQKNNDPEQFFQYRFSDASTVITQGPLFGSNLTLAMGPDENTLPVELTSLTATIDRRDVHLNWTTASEINNSGFDIERKAEGSETWSKEGFVEGNGTTNKAKNYSFADHGLNTGKYNYRLKQIDYNGNFEYFNLSSDVIIGVPGKYNLSQNYPNPFNPTSKINFDLPFDSKVTMKIFDITGREITTLINDVHEAGYYTVTFNAANIASGMYFYRIIAEGGTGSRYVMTKKMMVIK